MDYADFLSQETITVQPSGHEVNAEDLHPGLFDFQRDIVQWAIRKGRAATFCDTGLGKTILQISWAQQVGKRSLILAPLAVAQQTVREGAKWGIPVRYIQSASDVDDGIHITNYEKLHRLNPDAFDAVALDESSVLKSFEGKTRTALIEAFSQTPYRLCCTATPAPNDIAELANHAEFLGVMSRVEMLATFFVHDDQGWRLKGHARENFYRWMASWSISLKRPSDLGYSDEGYNLPPLSIHPHIIPSDYTPAGQLFAVGLKGVSDRAAVRKGTLETRVKATAEMILSSRDPWIAWVGLNDEGQALAKLIPDAVLIEGSHTPEQKAASMERFLSGDARVLISKPSICGFGLNFQHCADMAFVGMGDSYEQYYQAIRRCYRFGQSRPVNVHVVLTDLEEPIFHNVLRKEREAEETSRELVKHVAEFEKEEIKGSSRRGFMYETKEVSGNGWRFLLGDSSERMKELEPQSMDLSVFSPPFGSLYTYSPTERDLGNCKNQEEFWHHFSFISEGLMRVMKPGRIVCVHVAQIPMQKWKDGEIGLQDFRGETIQHFREAGFIHHGEVCIDKDPQAQAIRTKSKALLFTQFHKDSSWSRPALADYILLFRTPGENRVPIQPDVTNDQWIEWARPIWYGIRESDTLNVVEARSEEDERHICPLQLETIERCIRLWSNKGETVFTPFGGIGSEVYQALTLHRQGVGIELKPEYFKVAVKNCRDAEHKATAGSLLSLLDHAEERAA